MIYQIIPLSQTVVDWDVINQLAEVLGRNPCRAFDEKFMEVQQKLPHYLSILKEIERPNGDNNHLATPVGSLLAHVHLSFLMIASKTVTMSIVTKAQLVSTVVPAKHEDFSLSILSGTLDRWRSALLNCCVDNVSEDVRHFGTDMIKVFTNLGLYPYFGGLTPIAMADGTKKLIGN